MNKTFDWAVIGAGPAGIAAIGQLIDKGIVADKILWIDPSYTAGDFGRHWSNVSSNTTVKLFKDYLEHLEAFNYKDHPPFDFDSLSLNETCKLGFMVEPLNWVTNQLRAKVTSVEATVERLSLSKRNWHLKLHDGTTLNAKNTIIASGATPKTMTSIEGVEVISMYEALNPELLALRCNQNDTVAVFGSSHSAIILVRDLLELGVKKVINFYREPLRFAVNLGDWILFDDTGLKGNTAIWAREHLNGNLPHNLERIYSSNENVAEHLSSCTKAIHAIGFSKRAPLIEGFPEWNYNSANGIVAPGLFAVGIGFPESKTDPYGNTELRVGLWKFMNYLDKIVPLWLKYGV